MFVDIVRRGEKTTIISHHALLPHDGGPTAESMKQREQDGHDEDQTGFTNTDSNDIDTCAAQGSPARGIIPLALYPESVVSIIRVVIQVKVRIYVAYQTDCWVK